MAENEFSVENLAYTAGYWTEGVVRGTIIALPAVIVLTLSLSLIYLMMGKTLSLSRTDMSPRRG
jgi:hypothetical protein